MFAITGYDAASSTGLPFYPSPDKEARPQSQLKTDLARLYVRHNTPDKPVVAFKGGSAEKTCLQDLRIPHLDLEDLSDRFPTHF